MTAMNGSDVPMTAQASDLFERLIRLETKIDMFLERLVAEQARTADHETRIRKVERWMYALPPTVAIALIGVFEGWMR